MRRPILDDFPANGKDDNGLQVRKSLPHICKAVICTFGPRQRHWFLRFDLLIPNQVCVNKAV